MRRRESRIGCKLALEREGERERKGDVGELHKESHKQEGLQGEEVYKLKLPYVHHVTLLLQFNSLWSLARSSLERVPLHKEGVEGRDGEPCRQQLHFILDARVRF